MSKARRGRPEERLKIDLPFEEALARLVRAKKPKGGWPKPPKGKKGRGKKGG